MCPYYEKPAAATTIIFVISAVVRSRLCITLVRNGVMVRWPDKLHGSEPSRLPTTSFVVALSYEHMAFHVFVQAGCSDPCLLSTASITLPLKRFLINHHYC